MHVTSRHVCLCVGLVSVSNECLVPVLAPFWADPPHTRNPQQVLKDRRFPVTGETLRLFASERSAGKVVKTPFGDKTIELFTVEKARECDFVFLGAWNQVGDREKRQRASTTDAIHTPINQLTRPPTHTPRSRVGHLRAGVRAADRQGRRALRDRQLLRLPLR